MLAPTTLSNFEVAPNIDDFPVEYSSEKEREAVEALQRKGREEVMAQADIMDGLVGEKVDDFKVVDYLELKAARWYEQYETELKNGDYHLENGEPVEDVLGKGVAAQKGVAVHGPKRFYDQTMALARELKAKKLPELDGFYSRDLVTSLGVVEAVLKAKADLTGEPVNLTGLNNYTEAAKVHWKEVLTKTSG